MQDSSDADRQELEDSRAVIKEELSTGRSAARVFLAAASFAISVAAVCAYFFFTAASGQLLRRGLTGTGAVLALLFAAGYAWAATSIRIENRIHRGDLEQLQFELDLVSHEATHAERRAEKLLSIHERQLRRYYNLNLTQGLWVFVAGIGCVTVGIAIVGWTFYAVAEARGQREAQLVIGAVGAVGAILINYVAAVYLRMHASIANSLLAFHARLASTHELFLANLLVSRVQEKRRDDALCTLAVEIARRATGGLQSPISPAIQKPRTGKRA